MGSGPPPIFVAEHFLQNTWTYVRLWWGAEKQKREKCSNSPESSETSWINHPQSMPIVDRPEVTCYIIWLQVDKTLNIRRWSSEVICALKKSSYLSRAITATIIGRYLFLYNRLKVPCTHSGQIRSIL